MLEEINEQKLDSLLIKNKNMVLHFYTPFCATCQLAERMLSIAMETKVKDVPVYKCNVSYNQKFIEKWKIGHAPTIIFIKNGEIVRKVYTVESVSNLYALFQTIF